MIYNFFERPNFAFVTSVSKHKVVLLALLKCSAGSCEQHEIVRIKTGSNEVRAALNKLQKIVHAITIIVLWGREVTSVKY